jgi:hypothetical protein
MGTVLAFASWATGGFTLVLWAMLLIRGLSRKSGFETYWTNGALLRLGSMIVSFALIGIMSATNAAGPDQGPVLKVAALVIGGLAGLAALRLAPLIPWPRFSPFQIAMGLVLSGCAYMVLLLVL